MRAALRSIPIWLFSALTIAALNSCGSDSSTGPAGGVSKVTVTPAADSLSLGGTVTLSAAALDGSGHPISGAKIFWNTENSQIATVSSSGAVTGIATGTVRIAASSSGVSGFANITVLPPSVASVRVTPLSAAVIVGRTVHLQAATLDAGGNVLDGHSVTWSSDDEGVATVDGTGLVTGVSVGATTITATSEGKTGTSGIAVGAQTAASITVAPPSVSITVGQSSQLTATVRDANNAIISGAPVTWGMDNASVATVTSAGLVTGVTAGSATLTAASGSVHVDVPITVAPVPANAVVVSPSSVSLLVTQRQQLTATVTDEHGNVLPGRPITWESSNTAVAAVGTTGLVIAVLPGTATITATSGTVSGTATVTVSLVPVRRVDLAPDALTLTVGDVSQLALTLQDSANNVLSPTGRTVLWSSSRSSVATVTTAGLVTAIAPGPAVVSAKVDAQVGTATVTVELVPVATVDVTPELDSLIIGAAVQLTATPRDAGGNPLTGRAVSWQSSDQDVAIVTSSGLVRTFTVGTATITATSEGKVGSSQIVVVQIPVASVAITSSPQSVVVGESTPAFTAVTRDAASHTLTGRVITWSSSDENVATINSATGVATGVTVGSVTITATSEGKTDGATLTVTPPPVSSVTVSPASQTIVVGAVTTTPYSATLKDANGNTLVGRVVDWSTGDPNIATIDNAGNATGVTPGTVTITATSELKTGTASLEVDAVPVEPVASVLVSPPLATIEVGETVQLAAEPRDANNIPLTGRDISWSSSDPTLATVSDTGLVTGEAPGTPTITATSDGQSGTSLVTVVGLTTTP